MHTIVLRSSGNIEIFPNPNLGLHGDKLNVIQSDHSGGGIKEFMRRIINYWLQTTIDASWEKVISALTEMDEIETRECISIH